MLLQDLAWIVVMVLCLALWRQHVRFKKRVETLESTTRRFPRAFQSQFQFMLVLRPDGVIEDVTDPWSADPEVIALSATRKQALIGKPVWDSYLHAHDEKAQDNWRGYFGAAIEAETKSMGAFHFDTQFRNFHGESCIGKAALEVVRASDNTVSCFLVSGVDVTESVHAQARLRSVQEALEREAALLTTTLSSISQGIFMIGEDGRVSTFNPRVCELLELSAELLATHPSLVDLTQFQLDRGDFGNEVGWVAPQAREYIASAARKPLPDTYLRTRRDGRVLEVKTQALPVGGMVRTFTDVTDYVVADAARNRLTGLLQASQAMAKVGGWEVDLTTNAVFWTDEVYRILDTSPAEYTPTRETTLQFFAPEWVSVIQIAITEAERMGKTHDLEVEMITAKGRRIWVHTKSTMVMEAGRVVRRTSVIQDITAAKRVAQDLQASEELFRQITLQVPGVVYRLLVTPTGERKYTFISPAVWDLYGVEPEDVLADGRVLDPFRHPEDRAAIEQTIDKANAITGKLSIEFRIILRDGSVKWVHLTSSAVSKSEAGLVRNGVMIDITARKKAEAELRDQETLWKLALESTGDGVWDFNLATGAEVLSQRCLDMYGYQPGELTSRHEELDSRTHPDDVDQMNRDRQAHMDGLTPIYTNEHRIQCKDGTWKWIMSRGMVISRDARGKPLRMVGTHTDISERKRAEVLIWQQANFDALTGLPNRRMLRDRLEQDIKKCRRDGLRLALLFIDLDHFKEVNDTLGHQQGDALLIEAAKRIRSCVRDTDTVARMGGDEFTVVLPGLVDVSRAENIAQAILDELAKAFALGEQQAFVSASVGITVYPDDAGHIEDLLKHADQALYLAKDSGRNRFGYFTAGLQKAAQDRARLANDLRSALALNQFWVAYQPIVELATGVVHKAEALLRWQHPVLGLISPAAFIPIAESSGLIVPIGEWVFQQAALQAVEWRSALHPKFQISVNRSPVQFHAQKTNAPQQSWFEQLDTLGLPGRSIVVEITEGLLLDANAHVTAQLLAYRDAGIRVSLDDFGTGYSSLSYLQNYDIDYLKIDKSFVKFLAPDTKDFALCKAIIVMAHELGMKVIAEGVETSVQRDLLVAAGCDYGQGYLFAKPMPAHEFTAVVADTQLFCTVEGQGLYDI